MNALLVDTPKGWSLVPLERCGPPIAIPDETVIEIAGQRVQDPYRWLETCDSPEVESWQTAQDAWARDHLSLSNSEEWAQRLRAGRTAPYRGLPKNRKNATYWLERGTKDNGARLCVIWDGDSSPSTLVVPTSQHGAGASLGGFWPSPAGKRIAYQVHRHNRDDAELHVLRVENGRPVVESVLQGAGYTSIVWLPNETGFLYVHHPASGGDRFGRATVRVHRLGTAQSSDLVLVGPTGDPRTRLELRGGTSGTWVFVQLHRGFSENDVFVAELFPDSCRRFRPLVEGSSGRNEPFEHAGRVFLHSDVGAARGRLWSKPLSSRDQPEWAEVVGEQPNSLRSVRPCGPWLCCEYLEHASSRIEFRSFDGSLVEVRTSLAPCTATFDPAGASDVFFFAEEGFTAPRRVLQMDAQGRVEPWFDPNLGWDEDAYEVHRLFARAPDGVQVPVFFMRGRSAKPDAPTMLEAYGGFGVSVTPFFSPAIAAWLERGGQYAFACTRGGGEYGTAWHAAGRAQQKENVFVDFISAAQLLLDEGYCTPGRLGIAGESNGGLLIAAVLNRRPALFGAALSQVPITDMVGFARYEPYCVPEYGSPEDPDDLRMLLSYCPYRNVSPDAPIPPVLVTLVPKDERAHPMHARKWVAQLQRVHPKATILLRTHRDSGHRGPAELDRRIAFTAETQAFLWHHLTSSPVR